MKMNLRIAVFLLAVGLVSMACGLFGGEDLTPADSTQQPEGEAPSIVEEPASPTEFPEKSADPEDAERLSDPEILLGEEYRSLEGGYAFQPIPGPLFSGVHTEITSDESEDRQRNDAQADHDQSDLPGNI